MAGKGFLLFCAAVLIFSGGCRRKLEQDIKTGVERQGRPGAAVNWLGLSPGLYSQEEK